MNIMQQSAWLVVNTITVWFVAMIWLQHKGELGLRLIDVH